MLWEFSEYHEVVAALEDSGLVPRGAPTDSVSHTQFRVLLPQRAQFETLARDLTNVRDLVQDFAVPWCLKAAAVTTGVSLEDAVQLATWSKLMFEAAAEDRLSLHATSELGRFFEGSPLLPQMFVAMSQTLPAFLGNAWLALYQHPAELQLLRNNPELIPEAIEELLRFAGPSREIYRQAIRIVDINGVTIAPGDAVTLKIGSANRDATKFPQPDELRFDGRARGHLAFGRGTHSCVGSALIRMAAQVATHVFIERYATEEIRGPIDWRGKSIVWMTSLLI